MGFDPSDIKTTDPVKPSKKSSGFSAAHIAPGAGNNDAFLGGESTNAFKFDEFGFQPKTNADNYKLRAQAQGWGEQLVKTVGNTLVNIPLGIIEGVGYLGELFDNSHDYDNELISTMKNWSNPFGEVYRENPGEVFDLGDPAWWFNNVGQLVESAAEFALPGAYIGKGLSMLGKAGSTLAAGTKIAGAVKKVTGLAARGGTAMSLAYMEGAMSGNQVYKEIYNQQYERLKNKGMGPLEAEETARKLASQGAASTVRINTLVNTAMNFVSLEPFFKNSETKIRNWINTEGKIMAGESKPAWKARLAQAAESNPELKKILAKPSRFMYIPGMVSEGVEEVNTQYAEETGREVGGIRAKNDLSILEDYFEKVGNQEGLLNFVLGAVGGMAQTAILESVPIHQIAKIGADGKPLLKPGTDETAYQARRVSARTRDWNQKTQYFNNIKEAITADIDWYSKKNEDLEKAVAANKPLEAQKIRNEILSAHNLHAVMLGNASNWIQEYEDIGAIDNSKDLGEPVAKQIEQITAQIEQGKAEGIDTAEAEQQLTALQAQYNKVKGKTAAMLKGYAYDKNDHEYKKRARQAADDVKWMDGLHAELRTKYLDETNPDSEELINHIFSRAVTQHVTKRLLDEETQRLDRDEMLFGSIQKHQSTIEVAKKLSASLANDIDNLRSATDLKAIKKLLGKYKISVPGDGQIQQAVDELVDVLNRRNKANKEAAEQATDQLYDTSGFNAWKEMNPGKSFDDFLKFTGDTSPVDDDFVSRKVELQKAQIEYATGETALAEVKSQKGKQAFLKAAQKDKAEWTRKEEQKRVRDTAAILERKFGKEVAAKLNRASIEREMAEIKKQADELKEKRATLAAQLSSLNGQIAEMGKTSFFKGLASKVGDVFTANDLKDTRDNVQAQVEQIDRALTRLEARTVELEAKLEVALGQETKVKDITIDELKDDDPASNPTVDPPAATTKVEAGSVGVEGETYLVDSMLVVKINPDGENTALTERQEGSIEKAVQMAIDAGQTAEQIAGTLNALGYAFKNPLGMQAAQQTLINYIKNRINGTDTRNINEFAKNTKAVERSLKEQPKSDIDAKKEAGSVGVEGDVTGRDKVKDYISTLSDENYLFTHVTTENNARSITENGMSVSLGTGISSTLTASGKESATNQVERLMNGEVVHRDLNNNSVAVIAVPKAELDKMSGKTLDEKFENWLVENNHINDKGQLAIPKEFNAGYLSGESFITNKAVEQSIKEQPKSPLVISATSYAELTTKVPGEVLDALDNIEMVQKMRMEAGQGYSYDAAMAGLQPAIKDQLISVDTAHNAIILQKEYLTSLTAVKGEPEQITQAVELSLDVAEPAVTSAFVSSEVQAIEDRRRLTISMLTPAPTEPILIDNAGNLYRRMNLGNGYVLNKFDSSFEGYEGSFDGTSVSTRKVTDSELAQIHTRVNAKFDVELRAISVAPSVTIPAATVKPPVGPTTSITHELPIEEFERKVGNFIIVQRTSEIRGKHDAVFQEITNIENGYGLQKRIDKDGGITYGRFSAGNKVTFEGGTKEELVKFKQNKNEFEKLSDKYRTSDEEYIKKVLGDSSFSSLGLYTPQMISLSEDITASPTAVDQNDLEKMSIPIIPVISGNINIEAAIQDELEEHVGAKSKTAGKVNSATIQYTEIAPGDEVWDEVNKKMVKMTRHMFIPMYDKLDEKANHNILKPGFIQENDELEFRVDPDFVGEVNYDKMLVTDDFGKVVKRPDSFMDHADASGKIIMNEETDGYYNVPIAIYHKRSGEKIGYLPRTDWVTAKHGNAINYRNLRNVIRDELGNIITDNNVAEQKEKLLKMRKKIAEAYNAGNTQVFTSAVTSINPGHIFYNTEVNLNSENYKYKNQQTKNVLPDTSITFALINNGTVFVGHATAFSGRANFSEAGVRKRFGSSTNQPAVLLPMPNGGMSLSPIETVELSSRAADTFTIARAIEAYIAFHEKKMTPFHEALIEKIRETSSHGGTSRELDITDEKDLELFINQYFTYTQHFKDYHTRADRPVTAGEKKEPRFKLDIANRGVGKYSLIKIGTTFSGIAPMKASINADGTLNEDFENALIEGLGTHRKAITFTNGDLRGLNHRGEFHSLTVTKRKDKDGKWVIATKKHANYNEYVKTFTTSHVYGKHQIGRDGKPDASGNGRYVYGANPVIEFDMEAVIGTPIVRNATAAELADIAELELSGDPFADTGLEVFGDAFENDAVVNYAGTIEGAVEASIENLTKLQSNTPAEKRNSKSPEQVQNEMYSSGITQIAPDFNPFLKC